MNTISQTSIYPLCFKFASSVRLQFNRIEKLYKYASKISPGMKIEFIDLLGENCSIFKNDPLEEFKARARFFKKEGSNYYSVQPVKACGFSIKLSNRNIAFFGLSSFAGEYQLSSGEVVSLPSKAIWHGSIQTISSAACDCGYICDKCDIAESCLESHVVSVDILEFAKSLGILNFVFDPSMYWEVRNKTRLKRAIKRALSCPLTCC